MFIEKKILIGAIILMSASLCTIQGAMPLAPVLAPMPAHLQPNVPFLNLAEPVPHIPHQVIVLHSARLNPNRCSLCPSKTVFARRPR